MQFISKAWTRFWGKCSYNYYNWRKDNGSDLQLFLVINVGLVLLSGFVKVSFIYL